MMILVYIGDCIIIGKDMDEIDQFILSMQNSPENSVLLDEGSIHKFLGTEIKRLGPKEFEISQPFLIDCIVYCLGLKSKEYKGHCKTCLLQQWLRSSTRIYMENPGRSN
jgi:hypothetical protein